VDIGLVPVAEISRQNLEIVPGVGIATRGAVRSILLFSRVPWRQVQTLAADFASRTSVQLARVILRERFSVEPEILPFRPELTSMLEIADAALVIGDPALRLDPARLPYECLDLAAEWQALTALPFVFAAWAGKRGLPLEALTTLTVASYDYGRDRIADIVRTEAPTRGISEQLADDYLRHRLWYELGPQEHLGLEAFLKLAGLRMVGV
jgi:predicted solute-binding protein